MGCFMCPYYPKHKKGSKTLSNIIADWGEVKIYDKIPFKVAHTTHEFKYDYRSTRATFYSSSLSPELLLKRLNFDKPEFEEHHQQTIKLVNRSKRWASIKDLSLQTQWGTLILYDNIKGKAWNTVEPETRLSLIPLIKIELLKAFDGGFYFDTFNDFNIMVTEDDIVLVGWDNLKPIEPNKTFEDYYPWSWLI